MPRARVALLGLALSLCLMLAAAMPARAIYPQGKIFFVVWAPNEGDGGGAGSVWGPNAEADCLLFTDVRVYSEMLGTFGKLEVWEDPVNPSVSYFTARLPIPGGGKVTLRGQAEKRGPMGSIGATFYARNVEGTGDNFNGNLSGAEHTSCSLVPKPSEAAAASRAGGIVTVEGPEQ